MGRPGLEQQVADKRILLSVGEDSGDLHAANLMRAMRELNPDLSFVGFGMARMAEAGLESLRTEPAPGSAMWLHNILRLRYYRRRLARCRQYMDGHPVDLVVPVDFGGFNIYLCKGAAARGIPVFYYIPPQVWAHGTYRLKKLRKWTSRAGLIYPFEPELYERYGVEADYVGHPLFDEIERHPPSGRVVAELKDRFGRDLIGIFPGSRRQEVRAHLPVIVESCRRIRLAVPGVSFAVLCPPSLRPLVAERLAGAGQEAAVLDDAKPTELARASKLCITKSGTITLEIASQHTPMVILYRASPFVMFLARGLTATPYLGLINTLAGRMICPEKPMARSDPEWVTQQVVRLLRDSAAHQKCRHEIQEALDGFAVPGASARAARNALQLI